MPETVTVSTRTLLFVVLGTIAVLFAYLVGHHNVASGNYGGYYHSSYRHHSYHSYYSTRK